MRICMDIGARRVATANFMSSCRCLGRLASHLAPAHFSIGIGIGVGVGRGWARLLVAGHFTLL